MLALLVKRPCTRRLPCLFSQRLAMILVEALFELSVLMYHCRCSTLKLENAYLQGNAKYDLHFNTNTASNTNSNTNTNTNSNTNSNNNTNINSNSNTNSNSNNNSNTNNN